MSVESITQTLVSNVTKQVGDLRAKAATEGLTNAKSDNIANAAKDFEAVFLTQMMQSMFAGIEVDNVFGGGSGEEIMKTMLFDEYGKSMSRAGGVGISDHVQRQLMKMQGM